MSKTTNFELDKLSRPDGYAISQFNDNMDIIDTEMARPPLTINGISPDEERDIEITTVPLADNLTSDEAQINTGEYVIRSSGGEASISNGDAWLSDIRGNMVKTGVVQEVTEMTVTPIDPSAEDAITAEIDWDEFKTVVTASATLTFTFTTSWSADPSTYGITVSGTPAAGDQILVVYVKGNRGTITVENPTSFISTGWNLYNHSVGYARVPKYSDEYGFMIDGTYTGLKFASTLTGAQTTISPVNGYFTVPSDGYVFVTGGNATDTALWMTWADWTEEPNGGTWEAYSQTSVDLSGVMVNFPYGLMKVGSVYDEINLNTGKAYLRIERLAYSSENLETVIAAGVAYDTDTNYIYAARSLVVEYTISIDGEYTVNDHGIEMFLGTSVAVVATSLYGNSLKNKLERDVLTISEQTLTSAQKAQVLENLGIDFGNVRFGDDASTWTWAQFVADINAHSTGDLIIYRLSPAIATQLFTTGSTSLIYMAIIYKASASNAYYFMTGRGASINGNIALGTGTATLYWSSETPKVLSTSYTIPDKTILSGEDTNVGYLDVPAGDYVIIITANFASNATGYRSIWISDTAGGSQINLASRAVVAPVSGVNTRFQLPITYSTSTAKRLYVVAYQNSGSSLAMNTRYAIARLK